MSAFAGARRWRWLAVGGAAVVVLAVAGPFVYINFVEGQAARPLVVTASRSSTQPPATSGSTGSASGSVSGDWKVSSGSQAGYRVNEVLFGQNHEAVGRTSRVTGQLGIHGTTVTSASFSVDLTSVQSDRSQRDEQFQQRIMQTSTYPTATFTLSSPIQLPSITAEGATINVRASGRLTLHGTTRTVTVNLTPQRSGDTIRVSGQIPVTFADWNIPNPSFGPVSTDDHGQIEFLLVLAHA
jgi:polyisoprenoid-binding protein YceI